ncbi:MAG: DNA repair protein RecN, partial [Nitrospinae bacterium]|nr:DNA repair protein RecN [Nitrospinota bacterium]
MLRELKIHNFATIESLSVEFRPGFNVLTGETGAGKSIVIDALNLVLGGRADADSIRTGEDTATVEALFETDDPKTLRLLGDMGADADGGRIIVKRVLSLGDKNRAYLNGGNATVANLARVGDRLVDIHGQHDHQTLLHPESHVDLLDLYGRTMDDRNQLASAYAEYQERARELERMSQNERDRLQREDLLKFQIEEIDKANLDPGEEEELKGERNRLRHAGKLRESLDRVLSLLEEDEGSVLERLGAANNELESLVAIDPALEKQTARGRTAYYEIQELAGELRDYSRSVEFKPSRLEEIEDRLAEINGLKRKYGADIPTVLAYREKSAAELQGLSSSQERAEALKEELKQMESGLADQGAALAEKREKAGAELKTAAEKELRELGMKHARFGTRFDYRIEGGAGLSVPFRKQKTRLTPLGLGAIEFLFSPNPGEDLRPLARIASGGELSRVMLALKTILGEQDDIPAMVFDEVDAGIGGKVAETVGHKIKKLAAKKQVFCITHLPQIAGMAET